MTQPHDQRQQLLRDCHHLVNQIARRPGAVKLLLATKSALELYAGYKSGRSRL